MGSTSGVQNSGVPLILDSLIEDVKPLSTSPKEMDWLESGKQLKTRIMSAFGVHESMVGGSESVNRAQAVVAEESFCQNVINPLCELMSQVLTAWIVPAFGEKDLIVYIEPTRAHDSEMTMSWYKNGLAGGAVTVNEFRRGMDLPEIEGGDTLRVPVGMLPS